MNWISFAVRDSDIARLDWATVAPPRAAREAAGAGQTLRACGGKRAGCRTAYSRYDDRLWPARRIKRVRARTIGVAFRGVLRLHPRATYQRVVARRQGRARPCLAPAAAASTRPIHALLRLHTSVPKAQERITGFAEARARPAAACEAACSRRPRGVRSAPMSQRARRQMRPTRAKSRHPVGPSLSTGRAAEATWRRCGS